MRSTIDPIEVIPAAERLSEVAEILAGGLVRRGLRPAGLRVQVRQVQVRTPADEVPQPVLAPQPAAVEALVPPPRPFTLLHK